MHGKLFSHASQTLLSAVSAIALIGCANVTEAPVDSEPAAPVETAAPEVSTPEKGWRLEGRAMAAAANPYAVEAAVAVLEQGGHAVEAAIAAHAVLGLVEPQSSGIGGGAFMLVYDAASGDMKVYDGRETAPSAADETLFLNEDGETLDYITSWQSGLSTGAPGTVALYEAAYEDFGKLEWASLFTSAEKLAAEGFVVSPRLNSLLANPRLRGAANLDDYEDTAAYFYPDGEPLQPGFVRDNPGYASLMANIAANGAEAFYKGEIPAAIERVVKGGAVGGLLTAADVEAYTVVERDAVCGAFRTYKVCSAPPPSSGSVAEPMIMGLYERMAGDSVLEGDEQLFAFVDAQRLAYADRDHYVADQDFVMVPYKELIDPEYLDARVQDRFPADAKPTPGDPGAVLSGKPIVDMWGRDRTEDTPGTTHLSMVDVYGNAVSMTATVESPFGSSRWIPEGGFLLNNEMTDFSRNPRKNGKLVANAPDALKRPRSSMSPTIVLDDETGELVMVTGSPGGNSIIAYTAKSLLGVLEWGMSAQESVDFPNIIARGEMVNVEIGVEGGQAAADALKTAGYKVREREGENSGLHVIVAREDHYEGAADKRREGEAIEVVMVE